MTLATAAHRYAERGWFVFPLHGVVDGRCSCGHDCPKPAKHPRTAHGFRGGTTALEVVDKWWEQWPTANIGLWPGPSGLLVVDIDDEAGRVIATDLGVFAEPTLQVRTGRGMHLYFAAPNAPVGNVALGNGIDIRAHAGYVVIPPSNHISGARYAWEGTLADLRACPARLEERLREAPADILEIGSEIPEGTRNPTLTRIAGRLLTKHPIAAAIDLLWGINATQCRPPLSRREVESVVVNISKREARKVGATLEPVQEGDPATLERTADRNARIGQAAEQSLEDAADLITWGWRDFDHKFGGIVQGRLYVFGARPGNGKTTFLLNILSRLWEDRVPTLYFGTEMAPAELVKKWAAMRLGLNELAVFEGRMQDTDRDELRAEITRLMDQDLVTFSTAPRLDIPRIATEIARAFDSHTGPAPRVLVLDHLHRLTQDREELEVLAKELADITVERHVAFLVAAQLNRDSGAGAFDLYLPPSLARYKGSAAIEENAAVAFGLFRPLVPGLKKRQRDEVERGERAVTEFAVPNAMGVICTKHRYHGKAVGSSLRLVLQGNKLEAESFREVPLHIDAPSGNASDPEDRR
jgi:replicative DNA helicase